MSWAFALILLAFLLAFVGCLRMAFQWGWNASHAYLEAANALTKAAVEEQSRASLVTTALDKQVAELQSLVASIESHKETIDSGSRDTRDAILTLIAGFERAGFSRPPGGRAGRQHGEPEA